MLEHVIPALKTTLAPNTLLTVGLGSLFGAFVGAIPGLGTLVAIAVCLPFTFNMESTPAIALLLSVFCSSVYGGSVSAILLNTPGTPQSAATSFDGYALSRQGRAGEALGWATFASIAGGIVSCLILLFLAPQLAAMSAKYGGPMEICSLIIMGLACITSLSMGNQLKGMLMGILGLFLACVGADPISGEMRFTMGIPALSAGIAMLPICVGLYPIAEVLFRVYEKVSDAPASAVSCKRIIFPSLRGIREHFATLVRSSFIGTFIGILPGAGATPATFMSYAAGKRFSRYGKNYTKGEPDGLVAAEAANNAVTGGALIPTLALGLPGDGTMALMLFTFTIHDISPGVRLMVDHPETLYSAFLTLILANLVLIPVAMAVVRSFGRLLRIPEPLLLSLIMLVSFLGAYIVRGNFIDIPVSLIIGIVAFACRLGDFPVTPILIGYILGPEFEFRLSQVLAYKGGRGWVEYLGSSPVATVLLSIALVLIFAPVVGSIISYFKPHKKEGKVSA